MATDRLKDSRSQKFLLPVHNYNIDTEMNENRVFLDTKLNCERNVSHIQIKMENSLWFSTQKISNFSIRIITTISCVCVFTCFRFIFASGKIIFFVIHGLGRAKAFFHANDLIPQECFWVIIRRPTTETNHRLFSGLDFSGFLTNFVWLCVVHRKLFFFMKENNKMSTENQWSLSIRSLL